MKKFLLLFAFVATLCACERRFPDYRETPMPLELESDSAGISLSELSPEPYFLRLRDRPDSITVATAEYDELYVMAYPLSLGDEVLGLIERETPLGMVFYFIGVCLVALVALILIFRLAFFLVDLITYRGVSNSHSRDRADGSCRYVDLGLPSGIKWSDTPAKFLYSFDRAATVFGGKLPSTADWHELVGKCVWNWDAQRGGYTVVGPNGKSIFLPAKGSIAPGSEKNIHEGASGHYWSGNSLDEAEAEFVYFSSEKIALRHTGKDYFFSVVTVKR